jgi:hypothetical protein
VFEADGSSGRELPSTVGDHHETSLEIVMGAYGNVGHRNYGNPAVPSIRCASPVNSQANLQFHSDSLTSAREGRLRLIVWPHPQCEDDQRPTGNHDVTSIQFAFLGQIHREDLQCHRDSHTRAGGKLLLIGCLASSTLPK